MIAAKYTQGLGLEFGEAPVPTIGEDELLVRVDASAICGTDMKIMRSGHRKLRPGQTIILGHEFVGTIEQAGSRVANYPVGTRVGVAPNIGCGCCEMCGQGLMNMCPDYGAFGIDRDGAHTEFVCIPAAAIAQDNVIPLTSDVSPVEAALAEPLSCAVNGVRVSRVQVGDSVLVYGAGPMGLLNLMVARVSGAARVWVVDLNDARLEKAKALGANDTFNPTRGSVKAWVMAQTGGRGADAVIAAVPVRQVLEEAVGLLAPFGRLCLFAGLSNGQSTAELDTNAIHYRNLIVTGMTGGAPRDYRTALKLIESRRVDVRQIVSHVFPLREVGRAYQVAQSGEGMKIVMTKEGSTQ
jgi:threonine dehydrogenase-like Zn-dependent dehydrogenase